MTTCPVCAAPALAGSRYCSNCAAPLDGAPLVGGAAPGAPIEPYRGPAHRRGTTSGWVKALIVTLMVAVVAAVAVAVVLAVGVGRASNNLNNALTPQPGRPAGYRGVSYPGMLTQDHVAGPPGSPISVLGEELSAGPLARTASFFGPTLCSSVTVTNTSTTPKDVGPTEWKLQQPNGIIETFGITGTLPLGQVAPGGKVTGTICFADNGQAGTFLLLWQPLFHVDRGVWLLPLPPP